MTIPPRTAPKQDRVLLDLASMAPELLVRAALAVGRAAVAVVSRLVP